MRVAPLRCYRTQAARKDLCDSWASKSGNQRFDAVKLCGAGVGFYYPNLNRLQF